MRFEKRAGKLALWLFTLLFLIQILGATQHHHDLSQRGADCLACVLAVHTPAPPSPPDLRVVPVQLATSFYRIAAPASRLVLPAIAFLLPPSHAPPALPRNV